MEFEEVAWHVSELVNESRSVYVKTEPEVPDFTSRTPFYIGIFGPKRKMQFEVNPGNLPSVVSLFDFTLFNKEVVDRLYFWNFKSFCTYLKHFVECFISPSAAIIDLKVIENFLNVQKKPPESFIEAVNRTKLAVQYKGWNTLYKSIHLPLTLRVLPTIESTPLLDSQSRDIVYPYYEIEGQVNGRLNSLKKFTHAYLPHNLGPDQRRVLKPFGENMRFVSADFRHCEVTVLQWLSGDEILGEMLERGEDLHSKIYEVVTEDACDTPKKRDLSRKMFLPVMYGCRPKQLAQNLGVAEGLGYELYNRIQKRFPIVWRWMEARQEEAKQGDAKDYFGRPRKYSESNAYLARNAAVQGVAATICQEKLIDLWKAVDGDRVKVLFSVHDGFVLACKVGAAKEAYMVVKRALESESILCPGLRMKVEVKFGARFDEMKVLWK